MTRDPAAYAVDRFREPSELDAAEDYWPTAQDYDDAARTEGELLEALARAADELPCDVCGIKGAGPTRLCKWCADELRDERWEE